MLSTLRDPWVNQGTKGLGNLLISGYKRVTMGHSVAWGCPKNEGPLQGEGYVPITRIIIHRDASLGLHAS